MPTWNVGNGSWNDAANWIGGVPNAIGGVAVFPTAPFAGNGLVGLGGVSFTIGTLTIREPDNRELLH